MSDRDDDGPPPDGPRGDRDGGVADRVPDPDADTETVRVSVPEMDCPSCADTVEGAVDGMDGVAGIEPQATTGRLTVRFEAGEADASAVRERVEAAGYPVEGVEGTVTETFEVPEMDCPSCADTVEGAVGDLAGVAAVDGRPTTGRLQVTYEAGRLSAADVVAAVEGAGYDVTDASVDLDTADEADSVWRSTRARKTWVSGGFTAAGLVAEFLLPGVNAELAAVGGAEFLLADVLFLAAVATGGQAILAGGYRSLRARSLDIDFLMSVAIVGAVLASLVSGAGLYLEAATLAFLFSVAELLERYSMDQARESLAELMELSPDEATVKRDTGSSETPRADGDSEAQSASGRSSGQSPREEAVDGEEVTVPVEEVAVGDVVVVRPGEKVPMDGTVVDGDSAVDQSPITGESVPVDKAAGDEVYAGSINEQGYLEVEVTSAAGEDTLSQVVELVEDAQANKTDREQFVERFADYYTPVVVALALVTAVVPPLLLSGGATLSVAGFSHTFAGGWVPWFVRGLTLVVLACPCAFVISTPVSVVSGITSAAKNGVLIKGGTHLEAMGAVDAVALDKTGTLTRGELTVTDVVPLNDHTEADVLASARGLETRSEHPIADAIVDRATADGVEAPTVDDFRSITGKGVAATLDGEDHYAGKPGLFQELGFDLKHVHAATDGGEVTAAGRARCERDDCLDLLSEVVPRLQSAGKTVVLVGTDDALVGVVAVADEVRPAARPAVQRLRDLGVERVVMLTGDNERTAAAIADRVGIDEFHAELLPDEKVDRVRELDEETDGGVAMVGDGINDAPALATATVGVAMGAAGTDTALETADVALLSDDLSKLPYLYDLSGAAGGVIRQNVWTSLGAKAALALGVPFGLVPIWAAVLIGDAGMTVGVTANAMRLSRIVPEALVDDAA